MKKKIVQFIHGLNTGGAETLVKNYCLGLDKSKYDVTVLCYERLDSPYGKILTDAGIEILYACDRMKLWRKKGIVPKVINNFQLYLVLGRMLRELNPDILHTHLPINGYVWFARLSKDTEIFHTLHNELDMLWPCRSVKSYFDLKAAKWLVKNHGMRLIALHDDMRREANELFNVDDTIVLNNGIDFTRFQNTKSKLEIRGELNIPRNAFVLGHVGRFNYQKNHKFLVEIFLKVYKQNKNTYLLMIGHGEELSSVKNSLEASPAKNNFQILSNRKDVPDLLSAMDVFVFPSRFEGLGIVLIEAQKMMLPCVVSDSVPQYAKQTDYVRFLSLDNLDAWVSVILNIEEDNEEFQQTELSADWDIKNVILRLQKIYERDI